MTPFLLTIDEIVDSFQEFLRRSFLLLVAGIVAIIFFMYAQPRAELAGVATLITVLALLPSYLYAQRRVYGLPIVPLVALGEFFWFALPIYSNHPEIVIYTPEEILRAGLTECLFLVVLVAAYYALASKRQEEFPGFTRLLPVERLGSEGLTTVWLAILIMGTLHFIAATSGLYRPYARLLPPGTMSILRTLFITGALISTFMLALSLGRGLLRPFQLAVYIAFASLYVMVQISGLILASSIAFLAATMGGLALGSGKLPVRTLLIVGLLLNLLHVGKEEMRDKYWDRYYGTVAAIPVASYPSFYAEWLEKGVDAYTGARREIILEDQDNVFGRTSLVHMLIYAQQRVPDYVPYLEGRTVYIVPQLLIPRILWPDKPRTHLGQIIMNTHLGRQDLDSTEHTYIAWGLLAEFYVNFGYAGAVALGLLLGVGLGWITRLSMGVPLGSYRFFVGVIFLIAAVTMTQNSLGIVATTLWQSLLVLSGVVFVLTRRTSREELERIRTAQETGAGADEELPHTASTTMAPALR